MDDFTLDDLGTIAVLYPVSSVAAEWAADRIDPDALRYGGGIAIEHRYVGPIVEGILGDGLTICQ